MGGTGSRGAVPPIPGLETVPTWTSDQARSSEELLSRLAVVGGTAVGCESAQVYAGFGPVVTLVEAAEPLLPAAQFFVGTALAVALAGERLGIRAGTTVTADRSGDEANALLGLSDGTTLSVDRVLLATGRFPAVEDIGLEALAIEVRFGMPLALDEQRRVVGLDNVRAAGHVTGAASCTRTANYRARVVLATLLGRKVTANDRAIPRAVSTDPAVAAGGLTAARAAERGLELGVATLTIGETGRAWTEQPMRPTSKGQLPSQRSPGDRSRPIARRAACASPWASSLPQRVLVRSTRAGHAVPGVRRSPARGAGYDEPRDVEDDSRGPRRGRGRGSAARGRGGRSRCRRRDRRDAS